MWAHPALEEDREDPGHGYEWRAKETKERGGRPRGRAGHGLRPGLAGSLRDPAGRRHGAAHPPTPPPGLQAVRPAALPTQTRPRLPARGTLPPANHPTETSRQHTGGHADEAAQRQGPPAFSPQTPGRQGWGPSGGAGRTLKTSLSRTSTGRSSPSQGVRPRPASRAHGGSNSNGHRFIKTPGSDG